MAQILHLHGAHGGLDLQAGIFGLAQRVPDERDAVRRQLDRHRHDARFDGRRDGLDEQAVGLAAADGVQLDDGHLELVQQLCQLDLLAEAERELAPRELDGPVADRNGSHSRISL